MKAFIIFTVILLTANGTTSKPFLYSTSKWVFQKLFSSNSSVDHSTKNIEDLSKGEPFFNHNEHSNKTLQSDRIINPNRNLQSQITDLTHHNKPVKKENLENDGGLDNVNNLNNNEQNETNINESPGILQRKISKILNKLQLYSAVKSTIHEVRKHQSDKDNNPQRIVMLSARNRTMYLPTGEPNNFHAAKDIDFPDEDDNADLDLQYNEPFVFDDDIDTDRGKMDDNKLSLETGNIGIHIMEILGSIVTIFLSAAYQVGMYVNSFSGNNQEMVTSKPIEGTATALQWNS